MPETRLIINGPEVENTGPTNRSVDFDSENKSLETDSTRNTPEDMGFEEKDEVPYAGMTSQEMNGYATKKTAIQGLFNIALISNHARHLKELLTPDLLLTDDSVGLHIAQVALVVISLIIEVAGGCLMFFLGRKSIDQPNERRKVENINDALGWLALFHVLVSIALSVI